MSFVRLPLRSMPMTWYSPTIFLWLMKSREVEIPSKILERQNLQPEGV